MAKNLQELVISTGDKTLSDRIRRQVNSGKLRKIAPKIYTSNSRDSDEAIVRRHLYQVLGKLFPDALLSHRTALEAKPSPSGDIFLTYKYTRTLDLPGVTVRAMKGPGPVEGDMPFHGLHMSSQPRAFLENLQVSRGRGSTSKTLSKREIEDRLDRICRVRGEDGLNKLRDQARTMAPALEMEREFKKLDMIVGTILGTRSEHKLSSPTARARSEGSPYDPHRVEIFNELFSALTQNDLPERPEGALSEQGIQTLAFFEAYFSNYIEGTEFEIDEAREIVLDNKVPANRPEDAHDILGTYKVISNRQDMSETPDSFEDYLSLLKTRHLAIMEGRPEKQPGAFKEKPNRAGETHFVEPELVAGTLQQGYELLEAIQPGLPKAIFSMFMVAEVHPFEDGNGRIARVMMNAELAQAGLCRIIIPTIFRNDYLRGLRKLSRHKEPDVLIEMMDFAQKFVWELPTTTYEETLQVITYCNAFKEPDEGRLRLPSSLPKKH